MTFSRRHTLATVLVSLGVLLGAGSFAQDAGWRERAARDAQRAAEARRAEQIRRQYERRRSAAHARMRLEKDDSSLYASTVSTAETQLSCLALPVADTPSVLDGIFSQRSDGTLLIDIGDGASVGIGPQAAGAPPPWWPDRPTPLVQPVAWGPDIAATHADILPMAGQDTQRDLLDGTVHTIPLFPSASDAHGLQGIAQIRNRSARAAEVRIVAVDDSGREYGPLKLFVEANGTAELYSDDLESGNPDRGLYGGTGPGVGDWRVELWSDAQIEALSFVRTWDGSLMPMHDVVAREGTRHRVPIFHPASQWEQESRLRLINPGDGPADVAISGIDSHGNALGIGVSVTIPAGASVTYTAAELESGRGTGLSGSLGDGAGAWRLMVDSAQPVQVMNLLSSPTGHLSNLSTVPSNETQGVHGVPLLPASSDPSGRQGLVRVINRTDTTGEVHVKAFDDTKWNYAPLVLSLGAGEAVQFDSNDLEQGNPGRGLTGSTGPGEGDWRLELSSELDIEVLSYVRAWDGLLTAMHDVVPGEDTQYRVAIFNAQADPDRESRLRLINPGSMPAQVTISGADSLDMSPGGEVSVTIPAGASRTYTAAELVTGEGAGLAGSVGEAKGGRQLVVESGQPLQVMNLLSGPAGRLTNLSTGPVRGVPLPPLVGTDTHGSGGETIEEVFGSDVSPIVQAKCVLCHVEGGVSGTTRLVFVPASNADHEALNLQAFRDFLEELDDGTNVILNKVQGVAHGGGVQAAAGTEDFTNLQRFLGLLGEAVSGISITPEMLFDGVTMETPRQTLRRAALVFAGRIPTDAEYAAVRGGEEEILRQTIRGLMTGPGFHEFLIRASNDRLLTDRDASNELIENFFTDAANIRYELNVAASAAGNMGEAQSAFEHFNNSVAYGATRAPLELIAYVVENDLPYTEILLADYIMANPITAKAYGASTEFDDPNDDYEFQPSRIVSYYRDDESKITEFDDDLGLRVINPGNLATDYPHAGILNTNIFLNRYPSTATNRNRARSRWTYYHFLGVDVEKSASRTTDPVALADTNNPTMLNPACTVCHSVLDPVAGSFQNYGDEGYYRDKYGGMDSLDEFYKNDPHGGVDTVVSALSWDERQDLSVNGAFASGKNTVGLQVILPPGHDFDGDWTPHLGIDHLTIRSSDGSFAKRYELEDVFADRVDWPVDGEYCGFVMSSDGNRTDSYRLWECILAVSVEVPQAGVYTVSVAGWILEDDGRVPDATATLRIWAPGHFYQKGDTWYRDMRTPGFDGELAPDPRNSLQWLAQRIVADPRFAAAAVKFWWPAIMGSEVAEPPENEGDADFDGLLLASNAQEAEVQRLAAGFSTGFDGGAAFNLKDLLVEIALSPWFRAQELSDDNPVRTAALNGAGARRLLGPEELARKTLALTGFQWGRAREGAFPWRGLHAQRLSALTDPEDGYALLYGGIDSDGVTERARDITAVMAGVAQAHALQSSGPIVMRELYLLPEEERLLFAGISPVVTPVTEFGDTFEIAATSRSEIETLRLEGRLTAGTKSISLAYLNDFYDEELGDRDVLLDRLTVSRGGTVILAIEMEHHDHPHDCHHIEQGAFHLSVTRSDCVLKVPVDIPSDGTYQFEVSAWADQAGDDLAKLSVIVESNPEGSAGAINIRAKLIELFDRLHGVQVGADSPEVREAYELFVEVWERKRGAFGNHLLWTEEKIEFLWHSDAYYFDGIADEFWSEELDEHGHPVGWDWDRIEPFFENHDWSDPHAVARTWTVVLAYLLMDYRYLYL